MKCSNKIISLTYTTVCLTVWCQIVQMAGAKQRAQI